MSAGNIGAEALDYRDRGFCTLAFTGTRDQIVDTGLVPPCVFPPRREWNERKLRTVDGECEVSVHRHGDDSAGEWCVILRLRSEDAADPGAVPAIDSLAARRHAPATELRAGDRLEIARRRAGLSFEAVAERANELLDATEREPLTGAELEAVASGRGVFLRRCGVPVAVALDVHPVWLVLGEGPMVRRGAEDVDT